MISSDGSISGQLLKLPPVPDDRTAAAVFTAHRINDILTELAHAAERMQIMRKTGGELRYYHGLHFANHVTEVMDQAGQLKDNMLEHYPAEAAEWRKLVQVMNLSTQAIGLATGYDLNQRSGMVSFDLAPGIVTPVPGGVTDHHITVVYLGPDVDDVTYTQACDRAQEAASAMPGPLTGTIGGIGSFKSSDGSDGKIPVWTGVVLPGAERIRSALEDLSASEHKDWKPHVTLAYVRTGEPLPAPVPQTPVTIRYLSVHRGENEVARFPLGGGPAELSTISLSASVNPAAKAASFAHLLQTVMYDGAHAERHSKAMLADQTDPEWDFDADHAEKHLKGTREHALKLAEHIRDNYPAEWRWLRELMGAEELSNISSQVLELGKFQDAWLTEMRGAHGQWVRGSGGTPPPIRGGSEHYQIPPHERLINPRSPYPDPSDHPFFKAHPMKAENVLHAYSAATDGQKAQGMRWYADAGLIAGAIAHGDQHKGAGLLSAYSPQTSWPVNMFNAARSVELGRPLGPGEGATVMQSHANAAKKIMDGQSFDQALPAPKTNAFARLIERKGEDNPTDPFGEVVIDRHALSVAAGERLSDKEPTPIGDDRYYQVVADEYRKAAIEASRREGVTVTPSQMQAITWLVQQSANEAQDAATKQSGAAKGRVTRTANAWKNWIAFAKQRNIGTTPGTTALSMLYDENDLTELGWESQMRGPDGRWTTSGGLLAGHVDPVGFSLDPRTGRSPTGGFMVSLPGHTHQYPDTVMKDKHQLATAIDHTLMSEREIFKQPDVYLGGWVSDGKLWLDPSQNIADHDQAVKLGKGRNQVAIWDVQGGQEIDTGGTGGDVTEHSAPYVREDPSGIHGAAGGRAQGRGSPAGSAVDGGPGGTISAQIDLTEWSVNV